VLWLTPIIPATWEVEWEGLWFKASPGKMLARLHLNNKVGYDGVLLPCLLSYVRRMSKIVVQNDLDNKCETLPKNSKQKGLGAGLK
jgi:hypothetical protein